MSSPTLDDFTQRLSAPSLTVIAEGLAEAQAGVAILHHHPNADVQRSAADAMLLLLVARDTVPHLVSNAPEPTLEEFPDNRLLAEAVHLLDALAARLIAAEHSPGVVDPMAAAQASLHLLDAADVLRHDRPYVRRTTGRNRTTGA